MASLTKTPNKAIIPKADKIENGIPTIACPKIAPPIPAGITNIIRNA